MKNLLLFLGLVLALMYGCKKEEPINNSKSLVEGSSFERIETPKPNVEKFNQLIAANEARLVQLGNQVAYRSSSIYVPDDFATIQEAVDAASAGNNIFVNAGTYDETVFISTPGLKIQGIGGAQLNGGFLIDGASNVTIKNFSIDVTNSLTGAGVLVLGAIGGQVVQNTIMGSDANGAYAGIDAVSVHNMTIRDNTVYCSVYLGIHVISWIPISPGSCNNVNILQNNVSGTYGIALSIEGNTDNSQINGNTVVGNPAFVGIWICGCTGEDEGNYGYCDNNVVKNNVGNSDGVWGFLTQDGGSNNTIGPNNKFQDNLFGMYFYASPGFHVFNNTALSNTDCDIVFNMSPDATFSNNTYECLNTF